MKIIKILEPSPAIELEYLKYLKEEGFRVVWFEEKVVDDEVFAIVIRSQVTVNEKLLNKYRNLKYVLRVGVGLDSVDLALCEERGIIVQNTPWANSNAVADMAMWGLLSLLRRAKKIVLDASKWLFDSRFLYLGWEVSELKICIVWFGKIGKKFYERCRGFGAKNFFVVDPFLMANEVEKFDWCEKVELSEIISDVDLLALFVPLSQMTRNLVNDEILSLAKKSLKIINVGRGGVVNENDLYDFLLVNIESSAYLDVRENDPELTESIRSLMALENCIVTPHVATMTKEAIKLMHYFQV